MHVGRIKKILATIVTPPAAVIVIEEYNVSDHRDQRMNMPVLTPSTDCEEDLVLVAPKVRVSSIIFAIVAGDIQLLAGYSFLIQCST